MGTTGNTSGIRDNYRRGTTADFLRAKMGTLAEEADESCFWLELIIEGELLSERLVMPLLGEADELTAIFTASTKTFRLANRKSKIENQTS